MGRVGIFSVSSRHSNVCVHSRGIGWLNENAKKKKTGTYTQPEIVIEQFTKIKYRKKNRIPSKMGESNIKRDNNNNNKNSKWAVTRLSKPLEDSLDRRQRLLHRSVSVVAAMGQRLRAVTGFQCFH